MFKHDQDIYHKIIYQHKWMTLFNYSVNTTSFSLFEFLVVQLNITVKLITESGRRS